jgi:predicted Holliday junction resolvase-like endonuclease
MSESLGFLFLVLLVIAVAACIYLSITMSRRVQTGIDRWRIEEKQTLEIELRSFADAEARLRFEQWKQDHEQAIRMDAVQRSVAVTKGKEHIVPYLPGFDLDPKDVRFLGTPIDLIAFDGLNASKEIEIVFIEVAFTALATKIRPKDHIDILRPLLPERYSPLQPNGNGLQSVYLTEISADLAEVLMGLIGQEVEPLALAARSTKPIIADDLDLWERRIEREVATDKTLPETDRIAIIRARRGQGLFKDRVSQIEPRCRITGVQNPVHLVASHCKPWRDSSNAERLNGENGLLLTPSIDHLFDRGFIGFEDNGRLSGFRLND